MRDGALAADCVAKGIVLRAALEAACEDQLVPMRQQQQPSAPAMPSRGAVDTTDAEESALPSCLQPLRDAWLLHCPRMLAHAKGVPPSASASAATAAVADAATNTSTSTNTTSPPRYLPPPAETLLASSKSTNRNGNDKDAPSLANELADFLEADWGCMKLRALPKGGSEAARLLFDRSILDDDGDVKASGGIQVFQSNPFAPGGVEVSADNSAENNTATRFGIKSS